MIPVLDPLFVGGFHVIVYEPMLIGDNLNVTDEIVDDTIVGVFVFSETASTTMQIIHDEYQKKTT